MKRLILAAILTCGLASLAHAEPCDPKGLKLTARERFHIGIGLVAHYNDLGAIKLNKVDSEWRLEPKLSYECLKWLELEARCPIQVTPVSGKPSYEFGIFLRK